MCMYVYTHVYVNICVYGALDVCVCVVRTAANSLVSCVSNDVCTCIYTAIEKNC